MVQHTEGAVDVLTPRRNYVWGGKEVEKRGRKGLIIDGVLQGSRCSVVRCACYRVIQRGVRRRARLDNYTSRLRPAMLVRGASYYV